MRMKWIGGPNHNLTVWLVPRCEKKPKKTVFDLFGHHPMIYFYFPLDVNHRGNNCLQLPYKIFEFL